SVFSRMLFERVRRALLSRQAILEHEGSDAQAVEIPGWIVAFGFEYQQAVHAAGTDDDRGACGLLLRRQIHGDGRVVDVTNPIIFGELRLTAPIFEPRRSVRPKRNLPRLFL